MIFAFLVVVQTGFRNMREKTFTDFLRKLETDMERHMSKSISYFPLNCRYVHRRWLSHCCYLCIIPLSTVSIVRTVEGVEVVWLSRDADSVLLKNTVRLPESSCYGGKAFVVHVTACTCSSVDRPLVASLALTPVGRLDQP